MECFAALGECGASDAHREGKLETSPAGNEPQPGRHDVASERRSTRTMAGVKHSDAELTEKNAKRVVVVFADAVAMRPRYVFHIWYPLTCSVVVRMYTRTWSGVSELRETDTVTTACLAYSSPDKRRWITVPPIVKSTLY